MRMSEVEKRSYRTVPMQSVSDSSACFKDAPERKPLKERNAMHGALMQLRERMQHAAR